MSFLERIAECTATDLSRYRPFRVEGTDLGLVRDDFAMPDASEVYAHFMVNSEGFENVLQIANKSPSTLGDVIFNFPSAIPK